MIGGIEMSKTVRLKDETYEKVMDIVSTLQLKEKRKATIDEAVRLAIEEFEEDQSKKSKIAWARSVDNRLDAKDREIVENGEDILV